MDSKLTPLQMVARVLADHSSMTEEQIGESLMGALDLLAKLAHAEVQADSGSSRAISYARQYQAVSETVLFLGTQLIAFEDIEAEEEDPGDEWNPN